MDGIYINLKERTDRKDHFESNIKSNIFFSNIKHMDAISHSIRSVGCASSHLKALQLCEIRDQPYFVIMEDDFVILELNHFNDFVKDFESIKNSTDWKVIVLTPRGNSIPSTLEMTNANFKRIINNQTGTGYIIKKEMIPILIKNIKESIQLQMQGELFDISAWDQYWKRIQHDYPFYYYSKIFAGQLPGWSNIENKIVNYNERFLQQIYY
jgi:GR25 family glycosyltransferase involved in LPS biosynthesis